MEMHQVRYFLAVCRTLNFTKAADECHVTQPSLTRAVQKLEEEFGGQLFHRERANTHLTDLGKMMLPHLERAFAAAQEATQIARSVQKGEVAPLKLGVAQSIDCDLLMELVENLQRQVNGFELTLGSGQDQNIVERALAGEFDLALLGELQALPERMRSWPLFSESLRAIMRTDHPLARKNRITLSDLHKIEVLDRIDSALMADLRQFCARQQVEPVFRHRASNDQQLLQLALSGFGIALCPDHVSILPGLVALPIDGLDLWRHIVLTEVAGRRHSAATDAFIRLARARDWASLKETPRELVL